VDVAVDDLEVVPVELTVLDAEDDKELVCVDEGEVTSHFLNVPANRLSIR
jgi:hypothetical protein